MAKPDQNWGLCKHSETRSGLKFLTGCRMLLTHVPEETRALYVRQKKDMLLASPSNQMGTLARTSELGDTPLQSRTASTRVPVLHAPGTAPNGKYSVTYAPVITDRPFKGSGRYSSTAWDHSVTVSVSGSTICSCRHLLLKPKVY